MREFNVKKDMIICMWGCFIFFLGFVLVGLAWPFFIEPENGFSESNLTVMVPMILIGGGLAFMSWRLARSIPKTGVVVDHEGIWYKHLGKDKGLIHWGDVARVKENGLRQRLTLLSAKGTQLMRVEYQLTDFENLRDILNETVLIPAAKNLPTKYSKGMVYHLSILGFTLCIVVIFIYARADLLAQFPSWKVYGGGAATILWLIYEALFTPISLEITDQSILLAYPLRNKIIHFSEITDIKMVDEIKKQNRRFEVLVITDNPEKPLKIENLGEANEIYSALMKAVRQYAREQSVSGSLFAEL